MKKVIKYTAPRSRKNLVEISLGTEDIELSFSIDIPNRNGWYNVFFRESLPAEVARKIGKGLIDAANEYGEER